MINGNLPKQKKRTRQFASRLQPKAPLPRHIYLAIAISSFVLLLGAWCLVTYTGFVKPFFLPSPTAVLRATIHLFVEQNLLADIKDSFVRVGLGFILSVGLAVPIGILMGTFKPFEAFFEPVNDFIRYMPVPVFVPLCILWIGLGNGTQIAIIFIGTFFQLVLLIADATANCPQDLLDTSYTLGAGRLFAITNVILPYAMPAIYDSIRVSFGWAWSYLLLAEIVAANTGLGHMIIESQRFLLTDNVIAGIIVIGTLGLVVDMLFKFSYRLFFRWTDK